MYMPGFGLLASGLLLSALCLWFQLQSDQLKLQKVKASKTDDKSEKDKKSEKPKKSDEKDATEDQQNEDEVESVLPFVDPPEVFSALPPFLFAHLVKLLFTFILEKQRLH